MSSYYSLLIGNVKVYIVILAVNDVSNLKIFNNKKEGYTVIMALNCVDIALGLSQVKSSDIIWVHSNFHAGMSKNGRIILNFYGFKEQLGLNW